jgi:hypothetical protein
MAAQSRDVKQWLNRAEEARTVADRMRDPDAKRMMLKIADDYEGLARHAQSAAETIWLRQALSIRRSTGALPVVGRLCGAVASGATAGDA